MSTFQIIFLLIALPISAFIYWAFFKSLADEYGYGPVIIVIVIFVLMAIGSGGKRSNDEPIGEDRFGMPIYRWINKS